VSRPLDVALLSPCFWPEVRRGSERFVRELADGMLARGHRPRLITSHVGRPSSSIEDGLPILRLPRPPQGRLLRRGYEDYMTHVPLSYAALHARWFDVAHAVYPTDAAATVWWKRRTGRPAVLSYMGTPDWPWLVKRRRRLESLQTSIDGCDAVVALSEHSAAAFREWLGYDARVIAPGVDVHAFRPLGRRAEHPTIVCSADATEPRKNVPLLIEAFAMVRRELPEARLVLSRPRRLSAVMPREVGVEWLDLDSRQALAAAYGEAWVAALPSVGEAFGLVLVEAMACGTPVVGYRHSAIPEVVDRPTIGRLFDRLDAGALAQALLEALELAEEPGTAEACRARAEEFSTDRCTERYLALYAELGAR
jgi:glycosyltransferase involved in cell wall biosynthesis